MKKLTFLALLAAIALIASRANAKDECDPGCKAPGSKAPGSKAPAACDPGCKSAGCGDCSRCAHCGCRRACKQVACEVVCEIKKEKKTVWQVECTCVCPMLPGKRCGGCGDPGCQSCSEKGCVKTDCDHCGGKGCGKCTPPRCGKPRPVKKLVKKEIDVEKPVYKCVTKFLCDECEKDSKPSKPTPAAAAAAPQDPAPPIPSAMKPSQSAAK